MRIFALEFISEREELSRRRRGAKCLRGDAQSCGELFFSPASDKDVKKVNRISLDMCFHVEVNKKSEEAIEGIKDNYHNYPQIGCDKVRLKMWVNSCAQFGTKYILSCDYIKYILNPIKQKVFWYSCQVSMISV